MKQKYLLDTNICIYFLKGQFDLDKKISSVGIENCFISEITVAELKFGIENSKSIDMMRKAVNSFIEKFAIIPIFNSLDIYAKEKTKLRKTEQLVDDFDILIGATSIANNIIMVTNNVKHLGRIQDIKIENWTIISK